MYEERKPTREYRWFLDDRIRPENHRCERCDEVFLCDGLDCKRLHGLIKLFCPKCRAEILQTAPKPEVAIYKEQM